MPSFWTSSKNYHLIEPHPTAPSNGRFHIGRGGLGNTTPSTTTTRGPDATGPPSKTSLSPPQTFMTGRGGAGNIHSWCEERPMFSFDEELEAQMQDIAPVYHIGRGGAGNMIVVDGSVRRASSDSLKSTSSSESGADMFNRKLSQSIKRGWRTAHDKLTIS